MKTFEYRCVRLPNSQNGGGGAFLDNLERLGLEGWELCGFEYGSAWLKRVRVAPGRVLTVNERSNIVAALELTAENADRWLRDSAGEVAERHKRAGREARDLALAVMVATVTLEATE